MKKSYVIAAAGLASLLAMSQVNAAFLTVHNKTNCYIVVQALGGHDVQSLSSGMTGVPANSSKNIQLTLGSGATYGAYSYENFTITANGASGFNSWLGTVKATNKSGLYGWGINLRSGVHTQLFELKGAATDGNNAYTLTVSPSHGAINSSEAITRYGAFCTN